MSVEAVRVHISDADFYLVPETPDGAAALADRLAGLRGTDRTLRLRPRTAPGTDGEQDLTGHEDPGTSWRDVLGEAIGDVEVVSPDGPVAYWHWAIEGDVG